MTIPVFGTRIPGKNYIHRPSAYAVIRDASGNFAVARTPVASYLPGGGMETGETPKETVVREGREECGFVLKPGALLGRALEICYSSEEQEYFEKDSFFLEAKVVGHASPTEIDHELLWLTLDDASAILKHDSHRWALRLAMRNEAIKDLP